jgi:hypothetical protein
MGGPQQEPGLAWERIRANKERNTQLVFDAGLRPEEIRPAVCTVCGNHEVALYWTVTRRLGRTLFLRCPICEKGTARYKLDRNRAAHKVLTRAVIGALGTMLLAGAALIHYRDSAPVQLVIEELYDASASVGGNTGRAAVFSGGTPASAAPGRTPSGRVFVADGDRRHDLDRYAAWVLQRDGEAELRRILHVQYNPQLVETRVVVDPGSVAWPRRLHRLRGWRQLE